MFHPKLIAVLSAGLLAAACAGPYDRQASVPTSMASMPTASEAVCRDYGFTVGSAAYNRCVQREADARAAGRVNRDYAQARLVGDARGACYDYGLERGTARYDDCVSREVDARRYRDASEAPMLPPGYVPEDRTSAAPAVYGTQRTATAGTEAFHDEFGFRYDEYGNRIDRSGRIISPQDTTP